MTRHNPRTATLGREYRRRQLHAELRRISRRKPIRLGCAGGGTLTYDPRINRLGIAS